MPAPKGNRFWEARSSHGRKPIFSNPEQLWDACVQYFEWNEANPLWENKVAQYQGVPVDMPAPKMRAMTLSALCIFLDIALCTWKDYKRQEGFSHICDQVEQMIYNQKLQGASADLLNANIIARELGLKDKSETDVNARIYDFTNMSDEELERELDEG